MTPDDLLNKARELEQFAKGDDSDETTRLIRIPARMLRHAAQNMKELQAFKKKHGDLTHGQSFVYIVAKDRTFTQNNLIHNVVDIETGFYESVKSSKASNDRLREMYDVINTALKLNPNNTVIEE